MEELYAIKSPNGWLWTGKKTREEILENLKLGRSDDRWLICPLGEARHAITLRRFAEDPSLLQRRLHAEREHRRTVVAAVGQPAALRFGKAALTAFCTCMLFGAGTVKLLGWNGAGLGPTALAMLIPLWTLGGVGLLAVIAGLIQRSSRRRRMLRKPVPYEDYEAA